MALLFCDSFDHYPGSAATAKGWNATLTLQSGQGRRGTTSSAGNGTWVTIPNTATVIAGCAYRLSSLPGVFVQILDFRDAGTTQCDVRLTSTLQLQVTRAGTVLQAVPSGIVVGAYNYIEFRLTVHPTTGSWEVRVNGITRLQGTGNTRQTAANQVNQVRLAGTGSDNYDDFYIVDTSGTVANDFLGDVYVVALFPDSDVVSGWTPSSGTSRWALIDEPSMNSDTDYVSTSTVNDVFACGLSDLPASAWQVKAIQTVTAVRKDDAGTRIIRPLLRIGSTNYETADVSVGDTYVMRPDPWTVNPATSAAWTVSDVNALAAGARLVQ
jgi:hypothetical protein